MSPFFVINLMKYGNDMLVIFYKFIKCTLEKLLALDYLGFLIGR